MIFYTHTQGTARSTSWRKHKMKRLVIDTKDYGQVAAHIKTIDSRTFDMTNGISITVPTNIINSYNSSKNYNIKLKRKKLGYRVVQFTDLGLSYSGLFERQADAEMYAKMITESSGIETQVIVEEL